MNISYNWLKELIDIERSPVEVASELTRVGLAVEGIHAAGEDHILDIDLTSNRPDCLSHLGVARELGVITQTPLLLRSEAPAPPEELPADTVTIEAADLCHRFTARIIRNVKVGPSPQWLVERLEAIGERSINNVADITNYVMHELGQPMHSFDLDKLAENRIVVRRARQGEAITTLDEVDRTLDDSILAICDAEKPVAIAGIIGGLDSSITATTSNVLLEVAYFKRENIRASSRTLGVATEASYRFERGVDIDNLVKASERAAELICELGGGQVDGFIDIYPTPAKRELIESNDISASVKRLTGLDVEAEECVRILNALGIEPRNEAEDPDKQSRLFSPPSWRHDIAIEEDLVEEIARHTGYEKIATELPPAYGAGEYQPTELRQKRLRQSLVDLGFDEAISYSFIDTRNDDIFEPVPALKGREMVELSDSVIEGAVRMRPTLLPGLLAAVKTNFNQQRKNVRLFEIGRAFAKSDAGSPPDEREILAIVVTGGDVQEGRALAPRELDLYDAKGALEAALDAAGVQTPEFSSSEVRHLRKGQTAVVAVGGEPIGYIGKVSDNIATLFKFRQPVFVAEIDLGAALEAVADAAVYCPLPTFPGVSRDVSFSVDRRFEYASIVRLLSTRADGIFRGSEFVDVYEGKGVSDDHKSLTIRLNYGSDERTLIDEEVDTLHKQLIGYLAETLSIEPRF